MMSRRGAFTLIEMVVALISATALTASLAATIVITTELLNVPPDEKSVWHDNAIADRLASDLRYATHVDDSPAEGFIITRPDPETGVSQSVTYEAYVDGLTRQVDGGAVVNFDAEAPSPLFQVDGYTAPTDTTSSQVVRVRSTSSAATDGTETSLDIAVPPGCQTGDLLLLAVSTKTANTVTPSESGWQRISGIGIDSLRMFTFYRSFDESLPPSIAIDVTPDAAIAAVMVALENTNASPINWRDYTGGYAFSFLPKFHPTPLETTGFSPGQLNVQVFAANGDPWHAGTMGIASFTDAARATAATGSGSLENSIGIAVRTGETPAMSGTANPWHQESGYWLQVGIRIEVAP